LVLQKHPVLRLCKPLVPTDSLLVRFTIAQVASSVLPAESDRFDFGVSDEAGFGVLFVERFKSLAM
jgi:hypothetical protein